MKHLLGVKPIYILLCSLNLIDEPFCNSVDSPDFTAF